MRRGPTFDRLAGKLGLTKSACVERALQMALAHDKAAKPGQS